MKIFIRLTVAITTLTAIFCQVGTVLAASLKFNPSSGQFNRGCTVDIKVELDTEDVDTDGTDALIIYNPNDFSNSKITSGSIYADYPGNSDDGKGKITISGLAPFNKPFRGRGTLATISFTIPESASGVTKLSFDFDPQNKTKTTDSNVVQNGTVADVLSSAEEANFTIASGSCGTKVATQSGTPVKIIQGNTFSPTPSPSAQLKTLSPGDTSPGLIGPTFIFTTIGIAFLVIGILGVAIL